MTYKEFQNWMHKNCPETEDPDDLIEFIAAFTAEIMDMGANKKGISTKEYVQELIKEQFEPFYTH